ncbi:MAG: hypothetical protein ACLPTZ_23655 [Beijerinckiaceae bacterium]
MNVIDSNNLERDAQSGLRNLRKPDRTEKAARHRTFPHRALRQLIRRSHHAVYLITRFMTCQIDPRPDFGLSRGAEKLAMRFDQPPRICSRTLISWSISIAAWSRTAAITSPSPFERGRSPASAPPAPARSICEFALKIKDLWNLRGATRNISDICRRRDA